MYKMTRQESRQVRIRKFLSDCDKISPELSPIERIATANDYVAELERELNTIPSQHSPEDEIEFRIPATNGMAVMLGTVVGVHFYVGKVKYDLELHLKVGDEEMATRIYNVDSVFVEPR